MKLAFIISLFVLSNESSYVLLKKYGTAIMTDRYVLFESKGFKNDEEMHFKLQAGINDFDHFNNEIHDIKYRYTDSNGISIASYYNAYRKNHDTQEGYLQNSYFTIKKKSSEFRSTNGDYMMIYFPNLYLTTDYNPIIVNTEEDEGKVETWVIVVIVVVIVAIIAGIIIYCVCRRIRMKRAQQAAMATNVAVMNAQNQAAAIHAQNQAAAYNYAAQNAAYQAAAVENAQNAAYAAGVEDAQNAMLAQKNYQAQVYQGRNQNYQDQPYQNNNYGSSPIGGAPDTGYNSNAVM